MKKIFVTGPDGLLGSNLVRLLLERGYEVKAMIQPGREPKTLEGLEIEKVACDLLDDNTCLCTDYDNRSDRVPSCVTMDAGNVEQAAEFAPPTCAYRLLLQGEDLPDWHHLNSGSKHTIHEQARSVKGRVVFSSAVEEEKLEDYIVEWPEQS